MILYKQYYFRKGLDLRYPNRWYLSAHPQTNCVQYWPVSTIIEVKRYIRELGFNPAEKYERLKDMWDIQKYDKKYNSRSLFIVFKNKADEAHFIMLVGDGFNTYE
jgi:hypothetical protein